MVAARQSDPSFPHISVRTVLGQPEPYVPGTGLSVWEIVWLWREYKGDVDALTRHLEIDRALIEEALDYRSRYPREIDVAVLEQESRDEEYLRSLFTRMSTSPQLAHDTTDR